MPSRTSRPFARPSLSNDVLLHRARTAHSLNRLSDAERLYRKYLAIKPDDADALRNLGAIGLQMGQAEAAIGLLRRSLEIDNTSADAQCNLGLALKQAGHLEEAEQAYRSAIALDPIIVDAHSNLGVLLIEMNRYEEARDALRAAVALAPDNGGVLANLGLLELRSSRPEQALEILFAASRLEPDNAQILANLGGLLSDQTRYNEAIGFLKKANAQEPKQANICFNLGRCYFNIGKLTKAIKSYAEAIKIDPSFAEAHHNLGHALLAKGRLEEGWREYDWRWLSPNYEHSRNISVVPVWGKESIKNKRLLIRSEQGIGDKILFASILPELTPFGGEITLETEKRLVPVFQRSFPQLSVRPVVDNLKDYDYQISLGDLPGLFRQQFISFRKTGAYLLPDRGIKENLRAKYQEHNKILVGISWHSKKPKTVALAQFAPLFESLNCKFVNLQYGDHSAEIQRFEAEAGQRILTDEDIDPIKDFDPFVAQVSAMDAVITVQNTTLYTAGALGIPTFAILPPIPDWKWLGQKTLSPWHDSVSLFHRSDQFDDGELRQFSRASKNIWQI